MKKPLFLTVLFLSLTLSAIAQPAVWGDWQTWGNQGDGSYLNPVLPADFSDIDCIAHDGWYYAISSTFQFSPGMVILRSRNMVDWEICSHAVPDLTQIGPALDYDVMDRYARGIWAGAIRYADGRFYLYFGCPDEGLFMTTAKRIKGPWAPLHKMNIDGGWDDPCPLFDDDGNKYLTATHFADGYKTWIFRMTDDGKEVDLSSGVLLNEDCGREANKLYRFRGKYYHLYSEDADGGRYLMMQRADHPMGPYTEKHRLCRTQRAWHEPNQGGYLQDRDGNWFFLTHHGMGYWGGRIASLLPVTWTGDGWPVIGEPDEEEVGNMVWRHALPVAGKSRSTDRYDTFTSPAFEWNYQPRKGFFKLSRKKLVLKAFRPLEKDNLLKAGNTLTLRSWASARNEASVQVDLRSMAEGQRSGLCHFSVTWSEFGVKMEGGKRLLYYRTEEGEDRVIREDVPARLHLRSSWGLDGASRYSYSLDGKEWTDAGPLYYLRWGHYRGDRLGLFTYNDQSDSGKAVFRRFRYNVSQEPPLENPFGNALVPDMIADASIEEIDGVFYCHATTDGYGRGLETSGPPVVWKSRDFVHWSFEGTSFPQAEKEKYWAPSKAVPANGRYYLYPTVNSYMYPAVSDRPDGPFQLVKGDSFTVENRLWVMDRVHAIDAEVFVDDDGKAYAFWGSRHVSLLKPDMATIDILYPTIPTRRTEYSEGPIFFQRNGIYYYLYTIGGDENYEYYYQMSTESPLGPWVTPEKDLVCTTDVEKGVFGPGHGCVFNVEGTDDYYLAFLEFGRNSTNRQTYVNKLEFNEDGTIRQLDVSLDGVGFLHPDDHPGEIRPVAVSASSEAPRHMIRYFKDWRCQRTEQFPAAFAIDGANGSRWMAEEKDEEPWIQVDLGRIRTVGSSEIAFVRPTAGHAYRLEGSTDGKKWEPIGGQDAVRMRSPHVDVLNAPYRYLRVSITEGVKGVWEWHLYE